MAHPIPAEILNDPIRRFLLVDYMRRLLVSIPDGVTLSSWYRTPAGNELVGGQPDSQHLLALATDWVGRGPALDRMAELARARGLVAVPFLSRDGSPALHVQRFPAGALRALGLL